MKLTFWVACIAVLQFLAVDARASRRDTTRAQWVITPRLHSIGFFPFTGAVLNHHPSADLNIYFQQRKYGFFLYQSADLLDRHSFVNYLQPGVFRSFQVSRRLEARLFLSYICSQSAGWFDRYSDYVVAPAFYWTVSPSLKLESTTLFFDLTQGAKVATRARVMYDWRGFRFESFLWYRAVFSEQGGALSASVGISLPRAALAPHVFVQTTISYMGYVTEKKPDFAARDGLLFTLAMPMEWVDR